MSPLEFALALFGVSLGAGFFGSLVGLGGGIIVVPALTLLFGIDIRYAIGASIVSVIGTSSGAAAAYVRQHLTNLRVAMFLELGTTAGAICGAYLAGILHGRWLYLIFGLVLAQSAFSMVRRMKVPAGPVPPDRWADQLQLHGSYFDEARGRDVPYRVTGTTLGLAFMWFAGLFSGLLGLGSGTLKVSAMDIAMRLPIKISTATSNLMIGVTAAASAGIYFVRGDIDPIVAAPVALGVVTGAIGGSRILGRTQSHVLRLIFLAVLLFVSTQMIWKSFR
jgi:uncharacterized membrane protein YfcA